MFIVDRIEDEIVVVEFEGRTYDLPRKITPSIIKEGDVLRIELYVDDKATNNRYNKVKNLVDDLFE